VREVTPLLRWVGNKRWQVPLIQRCLANDGGFHKRVVELFGGSAAVSFGLQPLKALINDANPHLINFYEHIKRGGWVDLSGATNEREYYTRRDWFNRLVREGRANTQMAAALFYYLNAAGFNHLCRFNKAGEFNVPFRKGLTSIPPLPEDLCDLSRWTFTNEDFREVELDCFDFVYADPPYVGTFDGYTEGGFSLGDFNELVWLLRNHPGRVVITNSATPAVIGILTALDYRVQVLESAQMMQRSRGRSDSVPEVIATNFAVDFADTIEVEKE
jgi:DNA adenine methylase